MGGGGPLDPPPPYGPIYNLEHLPSAFGNVLLCSLVGLSSFPKRGVGGGWKVCVEDRALPEKGWFRAQGPCSFAVVFDNHHHANKRHPTHPAYTI